jgi:hypothetical protein
VADQGIQRITSNPVPKPRTPADLKRSVTIRGLKIGVEVQTGSCGSRRRIRLRAWHRIAGSAVLVSRQTFAAQATEADITAMLRRLRLLPCRVPGCRNLRLAGDGKISGNEKGYCEPHRRRDLRRAAAKEESRRDSTATQYDAWMRSKGFRYKATLWIHRGDRNESAVALYRVDKPTRAELRNEAARRQSRILDDFHIDQLQRG